MKIRMFVIITLLERQMCETKVVEKIKTLIYFQYFSFCGNRALCETVWNNMLGSYRLQMTIYYSA